MPRRTPSSGYVTDYSLTLTGTAVATIPLVVVFGLLGRHIIDGLMQGAIKG
jgi:cellobiose transport system permease protein